MKISKLLPVLSAFAVSAACLTARAEDNPAQAAARIALAKQLFETSGQQSTATNAPAAELKPVNDKEAKAKAKQDTADLKARQEADKKLAAEKEREAKTAAKQAEAKAKADQAADNSAAKQEADKKSEAERAALSTAMADSAAKNTVTNAPAATAKTAKAKKEKKQKPAPAAAAQQPAKTSEPGYAGKDLGMKPLAAPALPISTSKEEQLQALLAKYKADQISPEEYQKQRAAILAEP